MSARRPGQVDNPAPDAPRSVARPKAWLAQWGSLFAGLALAACGPSNTLRPEATPGADPKQGKIIVTRMACGSCHQIPGAEAADGAVGPSLAHFASRQMIAGMLPNNPRNLYRYLKSPQSVAPGNVMPDQHLSDPQIRHISAFLYTLK